MKGWYTFSIPASFAPGIDALMFLLLLACGLKNVLPGPPVLTGDDRAALDPFRASGAVYSTPAPDAPPVLAVQVWGLQYALDVVIESTHPDWIMHEYARVDFTTDGRRESLWLAKDAAPNMIQTITADVPDIRSWLPEVPVPRQSGQVRVTDRSTVDHADLSFAYTNPAGVLVEASYAGPLPTEPAKPRNGNTMGHSRPSLAALLDLHLYRPGGEASIQFGGQDQSIRKLWGLYPMKFILAQTQGGLAIARFRTEGSATAFTLQRGGADWPTESTEAWATGPDGWIERSGPIASLRYKFVDGELQAAEVWQNSVKDPVTRVVFHPALPDLRRRFEGSVESRFVVDIAGQEGHGVGRTLARWEGDVAVLDMIPEAPHWFADRPLQTRVSGPVVTISRVDFAASGDYAR